MAESTRNRRDRKGGNRPNLITRVRASLPARLLQAYGESQAGNYAAGLAFYAFTTMFPVLIGVLAIIGLLVHDPKLEAQFQTALVGIFPPDAQSQVLKALHGVKQNAGLLGILAIIGSIWTGTNLFSCMEFALDQVFGVKQRDTLRQKAMGSVMMIVFIVAVIVAVAANNAAAFIPFMPIGGFFTGWAVLVGLLIAIYRLVPNRTFQLRDVWQGAVLAGLLIEILTFAFPIYSRFSGGFNTYGQQFALFLLLAAWFAFLSQFLLLGAVFNRLRLGQPDVEGLMAAPASDSKDVPRPADAIKAQQAETEHPGRAPQGDDRDEVQASRRRAGSTARSGARRPLIAKIIGVILTAAIVASGVLRRKRRARQVA